MQDDHCLLVRFFVKLFLSIYPPKKFINLLVKITSFNSLIVHTFFKILKIKSKILNFLQKHLAVQWKKNKKLPLVIFFIQT